MSRCFLSPGVAFTGCCPRNLYEEGKVCLSILGTWAGDRSESWSPSRSSLLLAFFFNDTATTEIYTLSLHDALPTCLRPSETALRGWACRTRTRKCQFRRCLLKCGADRKSTRLNSSHSQISYAV